MTVRIDKLIDIVRKGGAIKTGLDIYNKEGQLLLERNVLIDQEQTLIKVKRYGIITLPVSPNLEGGVWDRDGRPIAFVGGRQIVEQPESVPDSEYPSIEERLKEIVALKQAASVKYEKAKACISKVLNDIDRSGGDFDFTDILDTVTDLFDFITKNSTAFSFLTREIFSYDDYLYNHSINVCTIGTVIIDNFNRYFNSAINKYLSEIPFDYFGEEQPLKEDSFYYYFQQELVDISIGYFIHDLGKVLVNRAIINKNGRLTDQEFETVKTHSWKKGVDVLEKNKIHNAVIQNIIQFHHARLFSDEERCYPNLSPHNVPIYVRVCKLADIYDAMTSKRCYKDALNPVRAVTDIFHKYEKKDRLLQFILYAFVKSIGIYPPGSIVTLVNGQLAYIIDSNGPLILPFTDTKRNTLKHRSDLVDLRGKNPPSPGLIVDRQQQLLSPAETYDLLPAYLKRLVGETK